MVHAPSLCFLIADLRVLSVYVRFVLVVAETKKFLYQDVWVSLTNHYSNVAPHPSITAL